MKKRLIICLALVAVMVSCVKEPKIYRRLSPDEAAIVPYRMGDSIRMLNQNGDTLCFAVVRDTTYLASYFDEDYEDFYYFYSGKKIPDRPYYYMRNVVLNGCFNDSCNCRFRFRVIPGMKVIINYEEFIPGGTDYQGNPCNFWNIVWERSLSLDDLPTMNFTINGTTYQDVYYTEWTNADDTSSWAYYYSKQYGLIAVKLNDNALHYSLTLLP